MIDQIDPRIVNIIQNFISFQKSTIPPDEYIDPTAIIDMYRTSLGKYVKISGEEQIRIKKIESTTDLKAEIRLILPCGEYYTVEFTHTGKYSFNEFFDADHNSDFVVRGISIIKFKDYKIIECRSILDTWQVMKFTGRATFKAGDTKRIQQYMDIFKEGGVFDKESGFDL